jgi:hypothetical protein
MGLLHPYVPRMEVTVRRGERLAGLDNFFGI